MMSMKQEGKPVSFVEDCAVPLPHLADYTERLNAIFAKHGTRGTMYAHASEGCLHVRPVLNLKLEKDVKAMRAIAEEAFAMVREYKGSHSGEHGDGIVRSEFHETMFGSRIVADFGEVKQRFDPDHVLNPGKIVDPPKMDDRTLFRYPPDYRVAELKTVLDWSAYPGAGGGFQGAVEMCNNNGACRKLEGGVMCPSYRATRNEKDVTRGRANTLAAGDLRPVRAGCAGIGRNDGDAEALRLLQGLPPRMPDRRRHGQDEDRGAGRTRGKAWAFAARPAGRLSAALCRSGVAPRPARQSGATAARCCEGCSRNSPASVRSAHCRRSGATRSSPPPRPSGRMDGREVVLFADTFNRAYERENLDAALRVLVEGGYRVHLPRPADRAPAAVLRANVPVGRAWSIRRAPNWTGWSRPMRRLPRAACRSSG